MHSGSNLSAFSAVLLRQAAWLAGLVFCLGAAVAHDRSVRIPVLKDGRSPSGQVDWRYTTTDPGVAEWSDTVYDDAAWATGQADQAGGAYPGCPLRLHRDRFPIRGCGAQGLGETHSRKGLARVPRPYGKAPAPPCGPGRGGRNRIGPGIGGPVDPIWAGRKPPQHPPGGGPARVTYPCRLPSEPACSGIIGIPPRGAASGALINLP